MFLRCQIVEITRYLRDELKLGGRERIRTSGTVTRTPDFESGAFDHSATLPSILLHRVLPELRPAASRFGVDSSATRVEFLRSTLSLRAPKGQLVVLLCCWTLIPRRRRVEQCQEQGGAGRLHRRKVGPATTSDDPRLRNPYLYRRRQLGMLARFNLQSIRPKLTLRTEPTMKEHRSPMASQ